MAKNTHGQQSAAGLRQVRLWDPTLETQEREDGTLIISQVDALEPYPVKMTERLVHWAREAPDRTWMAQRDEAGEWRRVSYARALEAVRRLGQAMLDRGLSVERPLIILSGNDIEHALMALGAQYAGIPSAAISPAYSLVSSDYSKLRDIAAQLTPGLVFAAEGKRFAKAIEAVFPGGIETVAVRDIVDGQTSFADLEATPASDEVERAHDAIGPDTVAKFLFTSGTTGSPKAVIQTQRLMCSNQEMIADCYAFLRDAPPVVVDWAPWNHTASGNKVFNLVIYNGGTYYIDGGKPTPAGIAETIRNLREISPSWYFNVPAGYEMLVQAMEEDAELRESFFRNLNMMMYAGAGMAQHIWDRLSALSVKTVGARVLLATGLGSTETGPFALMCTQDQTTAGNVGIPSRGVIMKLVPAGDKLEARLKGPSVTPGYWRNEKLTAEAFDEEGFYRLGDALRFAVPGDAAQGFYFDGRIAENFKLSTGTWVAVGALRAKLVDQMGGLVRDAAIAGEDREELGAILVPFMPAARALVPGGDRLSDAEILENEAVRREISARLADHVAAATGSASRVMRVILLDGDLSLDKGEVTDKGSINQRAILRHRAHLVDALFSGDPRVIRPAGAAN